MQRIFYAIVEIEKGGSMAAQLGVKLGVWLWKKGIIGEGKIDAIRYAVEILCSEFLEFVIIGLYGFFSHQIFETFLYVLFFQICRNTFEGYHAQTIFRCFLLTVGSYLFVMFTYRYYPDVILMIFLIVSIWLQIRYCKNKRDLESMVISIVMHLIVSVFILLDMPHMMNLLIVTELLVMLATLPGRRTYER